VRKMLDPPYALVFFRVFDRRCRPIALFTAYSRTVVLADALGLYITKTNTVCVCVCVCMCERRRKKDMC
jgi:hypothetical protein